MEEKVYKAQLTDFLEYLKEEEREQSTRQQYARDVERFLDYMEERPLTKKSAVEYKKELEAQCRPTSVNAKLSALNSFFHFLGRDDLRLKLLKVQRRVYCPAEKELSRAEYLRLVKTAERGKDRRLALLLQTICCMGIRVSEVRHITVEAVNKGEAVIRLKGKTRVILIPKKLRMKLKEYIRQRKIVSGAVFVTRNGTPLDRSNVWKMMKALCSKAGVDKTKVFPHNLRRLFARCFYAVDKDIAKLADILGHSSINTTRIYILSSGAEHRRRLDELNLIVI